MYRHLLTISGTRLSVVSHRYSLNMCHLKRIFDLQSSLMLSFTTFSGIVKIWVRIKYLLGPDSFTELLLVYLSITVSVLTISPETVRSF